MAMILELLAYAGAEILWLTYYKWKGIELDEVRKNKKIESWILGTFILGISFFITMSEADFFNN